jgi:hypothetical protein
MSRVQRRHDQAEFEVALRARGIDREDHELLTFAVSWLPYGGATSEEIWLRFGLTKERYLARLRQTVDEHRRQIHPATAAKLVEMCEARQSAQSAQSADGR